MVLAVNAAINRQAVKQGFWLKVVVNRLAEQVVQSGYSLKIVANRLAVQLSSYSLKVVVNCLAAVSYTHLTLPTRRTV